MPKLTIFVSFEFDKDSDLKNNFFEQAKRNSTLRILSCSLNEAYPTQIWKDRARTAIDRCDIVVVLVGQDTHNAPGVRVEVDIAKQLRKPILQVVPQGRTYTGVPGLDDPVRWSWKAINKRIEELQN